MGSGGGGGACVWFWESEKGEEVEDVFSCNASDVSSADHLVVMLHGILGSSEDWKFAAEQFVKMLPDKVIVHCSEKNMSKSLDGVDVMGDRLEEEILEVIRRKPNLRKISFVAHSVGGLVARYVIGKLYRPPQRENGEEEQEGTIGGLEPVNFITVATPHLGSRGNKQVPFLFGLTALEKTAVLIIHWIFRRTGRHLFLTDGNNATPPLLKRMVEDYGGYRFMSALRAFKRRVAYSNVGYDHIVGWRTSSIRRKCELPKWEDTLNEKYPHVVYEELCKACDFDQSDPIVVGYGVSESSDKIEEDLVTALSRVSWEKVDVSFHRSKLRSAAHTLIQVKDQQIHSDGADVIQHMIDHFVI